MSKYVDLIGKLFYFIGIGGIGMFVFVYILVKCKLFIYGFDIKLSYIIRCLEVIGVYIFWY